MNEIKIIPYEPIHALKILDRNVREQDIILTSCPDWEKWIEFWKTEGPAFTMIANGEVVGCGGITLVGWGKGMAWTLFSSLFYQYKKSVFKGLKIFLDQIIKEKKLRRVEAVVKFGFKDGCHLLEHLGFINETPNGMKKWGPNGEDMYLFGRV